MFKSVEQRQEKVDGSSSLIVERQMAPREHFVQMMNGVGIASGMLLLWVMELFRNGYFRILDRLNVKPRKRRASAFPPGAPRHRRHV